MLNFINTFRADEDGAVTVDWVVLTAAIVALGFVVFSLVRDGASEMATNIADELEAATVDPGF